MPTATRRAKFVRSMDLHTDATNRSREITNHFPCVRSIAIDVNRQYWSTTGIDADRSSQNLRLLHQGWRDLTLNGHNRSNGGMRIIQNACGRSSKRADWKENEDNCCEGI